MKVSFLIIFLTLTKGLVVAQQVVDVPWSIQKEYLKPSKRTSLIP